LLNHSFKNLRPRFLGLPSLEVTLDNGKHKLMDVNNFEYLYEGLTFDTIIRRPKNLSFVINDNKWGAIPWKSNDYIECKYDTAYYLHNYCNIFEHGDSSTFITRNKEHLIKRSLALTNIDYIPDTDGVRKSNSLLFGKQQNDQLVILDEKYKPLKTRKFNHIENTLFSHVIFKERDKVGLYDVRADSLVHPTIYDEIFFEEFFFIGRKKDEFFILDNVKPLVRDAPKIYNSIPEEQQKLLFQVHKMPEFCFYPSKKINRSDKESYGLLKKENRLLYMTFQVKDSLVNHPDLVILGDNYIVGIFDIIQQQWTVPPIYFKLEYFFDDYLIAYKDKALCGIIDINNIAKSEFTYKRFGPLLKEEGLVYAFIDENNFGVIDLVNSKIKIPTTYNYLDPFPNSRLFLSSLNKSFNKGIIDLNENLQFDQHFKTIQLIEGTDKVILQTLDNKFGIGSLFGDWIIEPNYPNIKVIAESVDLLSIQNTQGKYCIYDKNIQPLSEFNISKFMYQSDYLTTTLNNGDSFLWKYKKGKLEQIAVPRSTTARIKNSLILYQVQDKCGALRFDNSEFLAPIYDTIYWEDNLFLVAEKNMKSSLFDEKCNLVVKHYLTNITKVLNTTPKNKKPEKFDVLFGQNKNGMHQLILPSGELVKEELFDTVVNINYKTLIVEKDGKQGIWSLARKEFIIAPKYEKIINKRFNYVGIQNGKFSPINLNN